MEVVCEWIEVKWAGGLDADYAIIHAARKAESVGVEHHAWRVVATVGGVAEDGVSSEAHVRAELVAAARDGLQPERGDRPASKRPKAADAGARRLRRFGIPF